MRYKISDIGIRDRFRKELGDIKELAYDLVQTGQITPVTIRATSEDDKAEGFTQPWMLVAGGRRMAAAMFLEWEEIKALTFDELPPLQRTIMELHENLYRKSLTWDEEAMLRAQIHTLRLAANPKQKAYETAKELKVTDATLSRDMDLAKELERNPELKKAGSRKAAIRMVETAKHLKKLDAQTDKGAQKAEEIRRALHTMDAREYLKTLAPGSVDLMYSDPLWGIDYWSQGHKSGGENSVQLGASEYDDSFENMQDIMVDVLPKMVRATKDTGWIVLHCGYDSYNLWRGLLDTICRTCCEYVGGNGACQCEAPAMIKCEPLPWIWYRPNSNNRSRWPELHEDNRYEYILVANRGGGRLIRQHQGNVLVHDAEYGQRIHANQKPVALCCDVITRFTLPRQMVVDPFFGSGAHLAAAAATQRRFSGCDLNPTALGPALGFVAQHISV